MKTTLTKLLCFCGASVFLFLISTSGAFAQYCESASTNTSDEWLSNVGFAGIENASGSTTYSNFTGISGTVVRGESYPFFATISQVAIYPETVTIYIDWNQNQIFEIEERYEIGACSSNGCSVTGNIAVPITATPGETRMRVVEKYLTASLDPCETFMYGEVEDYSIIVQSDDCTPPDFEFSVANDCANDTYTITAVLNDFGTSNSVTFYLTRTDGVSVEPLTFTSNLEGQIVAIGVNLPFGISIDAVIEGDNPICTLTRHWEEEICTAENDEACIATNIFCGETLTDMPFVGATLSFDDACFGEGVADVWYTFISDGSVKYKFSEASNADVVLSLYTGSTCNEIISYLPCQDTEVLTITEAGTYFVRLRPYDDGTQFYSVSLECIPYDCPTLLKDVGEVCDDGDATTFADIVTENCECVGHAPIPGELCEVPKVVNTLPYTDVGNTSIYLDNYDQTDFPPIAQGVIIGSGSIPSPLSYLTGDDVVYSYTPSQTESVNISVTNHGFNAGVFVFAGCPFSSALGYNAQAGFFNPLTIDGVLLQAGVTYYVILSTLEMHQSTSYTLSITSEPIDCPALTANVGTPCDDNNPNTAYAAVDENCQCVGIPIPENDEVCNALTLLCGELLSNQSFAGASTSFEDDCINSSNPDLWYSFSADEGTFYVVNFEAEQPDAYLTAEVFVGDECNNLTQYIPCTDFILSFYIDSAATYYIRVRPTVAAESMQIELNCYQEVQNGECSVATTLTCGSTFSGNTVSAPQRDPNQPFCAIGTPSIFNTGVWYTYTPSSSIQMTFDLTGSTFDTRLYLYENSCESLVCIAADDNSGANYTTSVLTAILNPTSTYYLYVTGTGNSRGEYTLTTSCVDFGCAPTIDAVSAVTLNGEPLDCLIWNQPYYVEVTISGGSELSYNASVNGSTAIPLAPDGTVILGPVVGGFDANVAIIGVANPSCSNSFVFVPAVCPPSNDSPCGAQELTVNGLVVGPFNNTFATIDPDEVLPPAIGECTLDWCEGTLSNSVWFTITVPEGVERLSIKACNVGTNFDTQLAAYLVGECSDYDSFTLLGANDDQTGGCTDASSAYASNLEICVVPGSTIFVQLDGYFGASGDAYLSVQAIDGGICQCVPPVVNLEAYPVCEGDGAPSYSVDIIIADLGSSDFLNLIYVVNNQSYNVNHLTTEFTVHNIPLGETFTAYITSSDPACSELGPLAVSVVQNNAACDDDCLGVPGGTSIPGAPCDLNGDIGVLNGFCECVATITNDEVCNATVLECNVPSVQTTLGATESMPPIACEGFTAGQAFDVWFTFTADGASSYALFELELSDLILEVFASTDGCNDLTSIACSDQDEAIDLGVLDGGVYFIRIYAYAVFNSSSDINLTLECTNNSAASLNGSVNWNSSCGNRNAEVLFYQPNTGTLIASYPTTISTDGTFSVVNVAVGTFDVIVDVDGYLAAGIEDVEIGVGNMNSLVVGSLVNGDLNGDNAVNLFDFSMTNASYGSISGDASYNPLADVNCNGTVNLFDISLINTAYGQVGDSTPLGE